jgi:hypothetical protein
MIAVGAVSKGSPRLPIIKMSMFLLILEVVIPGINDGLPDCLIHLK